MATSAISGFNIPSSTSLNDLLDSGLQRAIEKSDWLAAIEILKKDVRLLNQMFLEKTFKRTQFSQLFRGIRAVPTAEATRVFHELLTNDAVKICPFFSWEIDHALLFFAQEIPPDSRELFIARNIAVLQSRYSELISLEALDKLTVEYTGNGVNAEALSAAVRCGVEAGLLDNGQNGPSAIHRLNELIRTKKEWLALQNQCIIS